MSPVIVANHLTLFYYVISHCGLSFNLIFQVEYHELETFNGDSSSLSVEVRKEHTMYTMYTMAPNVISLPPPLVFAHARAIAAFRTLIRTLGWPHTNTVHTVCAAWLKKSSYSNFRRGSRVCFFAGFFILETDLLTCP